MSPTEVTVKILLLSGYDAQSHQYWRYGLVNNFPHYDWTVLTLPPRYFQWRIRGGAFSFLETYPEQLQQTYDVILATSMVDIAALKAIVPSLRQTRTIVYFHENQFEYPETSQSAKRLEPMMVNLYNLMGADQVVFNSHFNRESCMAGISTLLK